MKIRLRRLDGNCQTFLSRPLFVFRQAAQLSTDTLDSFHARLQQLSRHCDFADKEREIKSQVIQKCTLQKVRDKGLRDDTLGLQDLLRFARTLEATTLQSKAMASSTAPSVNACATCTGTSTDSDGDMLNSVQARTGRRSLGGSTVTHRDGQNGQSQTQVSQKCTGCGRQRHTDRKRCPAWGKSCFKCKKQNHFANVCRDPAGLPVNATGVSQVTRDNETYDVDLYCLSGFTRQVEPYGCTVKVSGQDILMEIDTGAAVSLLCEKEWQRLKSSNNNLQLLKDGVPQLRTYTREVIRPLGRVIVDVEHAGRTAPLSAIIVPGPGPNLLGRDWLADLKLDWAAVRQFRDDDFLEAFTELFQEDLGTLNGTEVKLVVDENVKPRFCKPRPVPFAMQAKVEAELDRLQKEGVIRPVTYSDWAAPIVPVLKSSGDLRICGDYSVTINKAVKGDKYPIPNIQDLYARLSGGQIFSKIDLSHAYQQLMLDEESQMLTAINTTKGLFVYNRMPFGISAAPGIFQRTMERLIQGIPMTVVYLDDILVTGHTPEEHHTHLKQVLERLQKAGLRLKREKCSFGRPSCTYLGHRIDGEGIHPTEEKVSAIINAPEPRNVAELRSFLGLVNYYHRFIQNLSTVLAPLYELLQKGNRWVWGRRQEMAFEESKQLLASTRVLLHYDPRLPLILSCDASPYGVGAVLSHCMKDGSERPVGFASRTLSVAEKKYAHIEKEALAAVFGVVRFHKYLYGREFLLQTDHKPLLGLLKEDHLISPMASGRIQRWALTLANYQYRLQFLPGVRIPHADGLSRLPLTRAPTETPVPEEVVLSISRLNETPVTSRKVREWTARDPILAQILQFVLQGWPDQVGDELAPYYRRKQELSVQQGVLLWGSRSVIPPQGRETLLEELHRSHPGIVRMKMLARSYFWWPSLDQEVEMKVRDCISCQTNSKLPASSTLQPWEWPGQPWYRIHIDFAGPFEGKMILVIVDAYSKFIDAHVMSSSTSTATIAKLSQTFATHGLPYTLVSDNGTPFTSEEFQNFCRCNGMNHVRSSPYHPASNGLAERAVQTLKNTLKKTGGNLEDRVTDFLTRYRLTPQGTTGQAPAELLMRRRPRCRLDLVQPDIKGRVLGKQADSIERRNGRSNERVFYPGDTVYAMNFQGKPKWVAGVLEQRLGPVSFVVKLMDGRVWRRHQDHILLRRPEEIGVEQLPGETNTGVPQVVPNYAPMQVDKPPAAEPVDTNLPEETGRSRVAEEPQTEETDLPKTPGKNSPVGVRRSGRIRKEPDRLTL